VLKLWDLRTILIWANCSFAADLQGQVCVCLPLLLFVSLWLSMFGGLLPSFFWVGGEHWHQCNKARQLFDIMPERSIVSWNNLLSGYVRMVSGYVSFLPVAGHGRIRSCSIKFMS